MGRIPLKRRLRLRKKLRIRKRVYGTTDRPRLSVFRSLKHIYAQIIDDTMGKTLVSVSTLHPLFKKEVVEKKETKKEKAKRVGIILGKIALEKGIKEVVFDRNGFKFHGRVASLASGAREAGLKF